MIRSIILFTIGSILLLTALLGFIFGYKHSTLLLPGIIIFLVAGVRNFQNYQTSEDAYRRLILKEIKNAMKGQPSINRKRIYDKQ